MTFVSKSQARFMFSQHPEIAKEFAKKTTDFKSLPQHVKHQAIAEASKRSK